MNICPAKKLVSDCEVSDGDGHETIVCISGRTVFLLVQLAFLLEFLSEKDKLIDFAFAFNTCSP